jgi:hypothetical protein
MSDFSLPKSERLFQETDSPVTGWEREPEVIPIEMANGITIKLVFLAISDWTQQTTVLLLAWCHYLHLEQQMSHPLRSTICEGHLARRDSSHQRVDCHPCCEDNVMDNRCCIEVGSLMYQSVV